MQSQPNVVFFNPGLGMGGAEKHTLDLRTRLEANGYPTRLLIYGKEKSENILALPGAQGAEFLDCGGASDLSAWVKVRSALARNDSQIVFAVNPTAMIYTALLKPLLKKEVVGLLHGTVPRQGERLRTALFKLAGRFIDTMVYVSQNQKSYWNSVGLRAPRERVILNGIDLKKFSPPDADTRSAARQRLGFAPGDFVVGLVATFRSEKNHIQLVEAHARVRQANVNMKVVYVGDGSLRPEITRKVEAQGLAEHTRFVGEQADVRPFVHAFDVGALCSTAIETLSLSAIEILACGVPLVLSNTGGASEIVDDGVNGYLFEVGDTEALVDRLIRLSDRDTQAKAAAAALEKSKRFSVERMVASYVDLIEELKQKG